MTAITLFGYRMARRDGTKGMPLNDNNSNLIPRVIETFFFSFHGKLIPEFVEILLICLRSARSGSRRVITCEGDGSPPQIWLLQIKTSWQIALCLLGQMTGVLLSRATFQLGDRFIYGILHMAPDYLRDIQFVPRHATVLIVSKNMGLYLWEFPFRTLLPSNSQIEWTSPRN